MDKRKIGIEETIIAIVVGKALLKAIPVMPKLKGNFKKAFDQYCEKIDDDIKFCEKEYGKNDNSIEALEDERHHVEIFATFIQNESGFYLRKKHTGKTNKDGN